MIYSVCKHSYRTGSSGPKHQPGLLPGRERWRLVLRLRPAQISDLRSQREQPSASQHDHPLLPAVSLAGQVWLTQPSLALKCRSRSQQGGAHTRTGPSQSGVTFTAASPYKQRLEKLGNNTHRGTSNM